MPSWRRTESRVVRPFTSVDDALKEVRFRLRADEEFDDRTSFDASEVELRDIRPEFALHVPVATLQAAIPLNPAELSLVIRLSDPRLHRSELVFESGLDALPETWSVPQEVRDRFSWKFGLIASVALVLRGNRSCQPGLPFMRGHWIARKDFSIRSVPERRTFPIERWTAEDFARRGLPRDSVYWIEFLTDDLNTAFDDPADALRVCLRADVYDALVETEDSPSGCAVAKMIEAEILTEVLWRGLDSLESDEGIERGSLLHSALTRVEKATKANREALRQLVTQKKELASLRAFAQAAVNARKDLARLRVAR